MLTRREFGLGLLAQIAAPRRPNVVVVLADDLGYADLGCYGGEISTPNLDRLAVQGIQFLQAYAPSPICSPSRVGLFTGQYPSRHGIFSYLDSRKRHQELGMRDWLDVSAPSIARCFKDSGYATAHFGKWHMGGGRDIGDAPLPTEYGFDESYTSFEGLGDRVLPPGRLSEQNEQLGRGHIDHAPQRELTRIYVDKALDFVRRSGSKPFYLQVWPNEVHDPFDAKPELMEKHAERFGSNKYVQEYYATLESMDAELGRLIDGLDAQNTLIVFASDNGPTAWPRYYKEGLEPPGRTGGLRGRKWSLYEGGIRVPLIARWTGRIKAGVTDRETVISTMDLLPSLVKIAKLNTHAHFDGEDMSGPLLGHARPRKSDLFWEYGRDASYVYPGAPNDRSPNVAIRSGHWKLLTNADGSRTELYDFAKSDRETDNVASRHPGAARRLKARALAWRRSVSGPARPLPPTRQAPQ